MKQAPIVTEALRLLTDEAERQGAECNDERGIVRNLVVYHGLGYNAWFCVCCELADRSAKREGYQSSANRAWELAKQKMDRDKVSR